MCEILPPRKFFHDIGIFVKKFVDMPAVFQRFYRGVNGKEVAHKRNGEDYFQISMAHEDSVPYFW